MRTKDKRVYKPNKKSEGNLYFYRCMKKARLINERGILTKNGRKFYNRLDKEGYYEDDGDPL